MPKKEAVPHQKEHDANQNAEGAEAMNTESMAHESSLPDNGTVPSKGAVKNDADKPAPKQTTPTPMRGRWRRTQIEPSAPMLTLEVGADVITQQEKENVIWHEIKNSKMTSTHLSGIVGKVERVGGVGIIAVVDYKGQRVSIPIKEMMLDIERPANQGDDEYYERASRVLNRMMGSEIDFIVRGITEDEYGRRFAVASRKAAMLRLRRRFYLTTGENSRPMVYPGRKVEARIVAVSQLAVRVEIFGVETPIRNRALSRAYVGDCRNEYFVGDTIQVRVTAVNGDNPDNLEIAADVISLTADDTHEKLMALKPQTNCIGKVVNVIDGVIFINLIDGVRAIAHKCYDKRTPGRGDDVMFICVRIDEDSNVALGLVSRIIKRNI